MIGSDYKKCIGCSNCVYDCPTMAEENACVMCGSCLEMCANDARHYSDDCDAFFKALGEGRSISVIIAASLQFNYPDEHKRILGYLKSRGVNCFYPVQLGADIMLWGYLNYIKESGRSGLIAQTCPSIVRYIERHQPELLPNLIPVQNPVMCMAIYLRRYLGVEDELALLSPCVAQKKEISSERGQGLIRHNVTFSKLKDYIKYRGVDLRECSVVDVRVENEMTSLLPTAGGLRENIEYYMGSSVSVMQVEGAHKAHNYLKYLVARDDDHLTELPVLIDVSNCDGGCCNGTGTEFRYEPNYEIAHESSRLRAAALESVRKQGQTIVNETGSRLKQLNRRFSALNFEEFLCEYRDKSDRNTSSKGKYEVPQMGKLLKFSGRRNSNRTSQVQSALRRGAVSFDLLVDSSVRDMTYSVGVIEDLVNLPHMDTQAVRSYTVHTHSLKSVLNNVGREELSILAETLEMAGREEDVATIRRHTQVFVSSVKELIDKLSGMIASRGYTETDDTEFLNKQLIIMCNALKKYDMETVDVTMDAIRAVKCSRKTSDLMREISDQLICGELEEIIDLISMITKV